MWAERLASGERGSLTPWFLAPVLAVVMLVIAITQVPGKECEDLTFRYIDDSAPRDVVVGIAIVTSGLLGAAAVTRWAALGHRTYQPYLVATALAVPPLLALAIASSPSLAEAVAVLSFAGSFAAVVGFFAVFDMVSQKLELGQASFYLPLYLAGTAWGLIPFVTILSLTLARHPICEFG